MHHPLRCVAVAAVVLSVLACERSRTAPAVDTTRTGAAHVAMPPARAPRTLASGWDVGAGPILVVRGSRPSSGLVIFPQYVDSILSDTVRFPDATVQGTPVDLFGRAGQVGRGRLGVVTAKDWSGSGCIEWPIASVRPIDSSAATPIAWSVGFTAGHVEPIALDSLEALARPDSAHLAAEITRLASVLPNDTAQAFRGVPFAVDRAYEFSLARGESVIVAEIVRRLNQEANPLEEQILLVAEQDSTGADARPHTAYFERHSGSEERMETFDVLAALWLDAPRRPALILLREGPETSAYALLERDSNGRWRVRWTSARTGC